MQLSFQLVCAFLGDPCTGALLGFFCCALHRAKTPPRAGGLALLFVALRQTKFGCHAVVNRKTIGQERAALFVVAFLHFGDALFEEIVGLFWCVPLSGEGGQSDSEGQGAWERWLYPAECTHGNRSTTSADRRRIHRVLAGVVGA